MSRECLACRAVQALRRRGALGYTRGQLADVLGVSVEVAAALGTVLQAFSKVETSGHGRGFRYRWHASARPRG